MIGNKKAAQNETVRLSGPLIFSQPNQAPSRSCPAGSNLDPSLGSRWKGIRRKGQPYRAVVIEPVSANRLQKTGISAVLAGDFQRFLAKVVGFRRPENLDNRMNTL